MMKKINPLELISLPIRERHNLPTVATIYFVLDKANKIQYVGQSKNLHTRWRDGHGCCADLENPTSARIAWVEMSEKAERLFLERHFIRRFKPPLNAAAKRLIKPKICDFAPVVKAQVVRFQTQSVSADIRTPKEYAAKQELLSTSEVAQRLNISVRQVQTLIKQNRLPATKRGRDWFVAESDLELVSERKKTGRPPKNQPTESIS